jgi:hypothetical protein
LPFFAPFSKMQKVATNGRNVKAMALLFVIFLLYTLDSASNYSAIQKLKP